MTEQGCVSGANEGHLAKGLLPRYLDVMASDRAHDMRAEGEPSAESSLLDELTNLVDANFDLLPLPPIPRPPKSRSHSRRIRARWHRASGLWSAAEHSRRCINHCANHVPVPADDKEGPIEERRVVRTSALSCQDQAVLHVLKESQRVVNARRLSRQAAGTGADLIRVLAKRITIENTYTCYSRMPVYVNSTQI